MSEEIKVTETAEKKVEKTEAAPAAKAGASVKAKKASAKKQAEKYIKVTLVKSPLGCTKSQIATVAALGLRKIRQFNVIKDNAAARGMAQKVAHLISIEEVKQEA